MQRRLRFFLVLTLAALGAVLPPGLQGQDCISGVVFEDVNGDGAYQVGTDIPLEDVFVSLVSGGNLFIANTDPNGFYEACGLGLGDYEVVASPDFTYYLIPQSQTVTLTAGMPGATGIDFAVSALSNFATIRGGAFYDEDGDGIQGLEEPGLPGVILTLDGPTALSLVTNSKGRFVAEGLEPGAYQLRAPGNLPEGSLSSANPLSFDLAAGGDQEALFIYGLPGGSGIVSGFVCVDYDGDGTVTPADNAGLQGHRIRLLDSQGQEVGSTLSCPNGLYSFSPVPAGNYRVVADPLPPILISQTPLEYDIALAAGAFERRPFYGEPRPPIFNCGMAVVTCFSGINNNFDPMAMEGPVVALVDIRNHSLAPQGMDFDPPGTPVNNNWAAPLYHYPEWQSSVNGNPAMGQVFGLAIDKDYNVFVAATTLYGNYTAGTAGPGGIYRINASDGSVDDFVTTTTNAGFLINGNALPNESPNANNPTLAPGLGNICYDWIHDQFFVTNHEDGKIYRIANGAAGTVVEVFDPFGADNGAPSFAPLGERLWGIGFNGYEGSDGVVYFSVWAEDTGRRSSTNSNDIFAIPLDPGGVFGTFSSVPVVDMSQYPFSSNYSNPISDIAFSSDGQRMLLAERTMMFDVGNPDLVDIPNPYGGPPIRRVGYWAHNSRLIEFQTNGTNWNLDPSGLTKYRVGQWSSRNNASGGTDFGFESFNPRLLEPTYCDSSVWVTGDALDPDHGNSSTSVKLYGIQGFDRTGGSNIDGPLIDLDGAFDSYAKSIQGDIEVFDCACPLTADCAQLGLSTRAVPQDSITADSCCYAVDYLNSGTENVYGLQFQALDGVQINHPHLVNSGEEYTLAAGFQVGNYNNSLLEVIPFGGGIMPAMSNGLVTNLCPKNVLAFPQYVLVNYLDENYEPFCTDTLILSCPIEETCLFIVSDSLACDSLGYKYTATVKNPSGADFPVGYIKLNIEPDIPGLTVLEGEGIVLTDTLQQGDTTTLMWTLVTSDDLYGDSLCFILSAHDGIEERLCCAEIDTCIAFPPCDPCKFVDAMVKPLADDQVGECCFELFVTDTFTYDPALFQAIEANILNAGVYFTGVDALPAQIDGWSVAPPLPLPANTQSLLWTHSSGITPNGVGYNLFDFCIEGTTTTDSVYVEINWLDADGMVACSDTVAVFCPDCLNVVNDTLSCRTTDTPTGVTEEYVYTFQVVNYSPFDVNTIGIVEIPSNNTSISPDVITIPTIPAFPPGGTSVPVSIVIDGSVGSDTTLCFDIVLRQVIADSIDIVCCYATHCVYLPPCDSLPPFLCPDPGLVSQDPCPLVWDPVCGCDDRTYSNICFAINAGITLWSPGVCDTVQNADPRVVLSGSAGVNGEVLLEWMLDDDPARYSHFVLRNWPAGGGTPLTVAVLPVLPGQQQYNFMDLNAGMGIQEYDVVAVGLDGLPIFSNIVQVMRMNGAQRGAMIYAYPVPAANTLNITSNRQGEAVVELMSADGRTLMQRQESFQGLPVPVDVSGIGSGVYLVRLRFRSGEVGQQRVVKME